MAEKKFLSLLSRKKKTNRAKMRTMADIQEHFGEIPQIIKPRSVKNAPDISSAVVEIGTILKANNLSTPKLDELLDAAEVTAGLHLDYKAISELFWILAKEEDPELQLDTVLNNLELSNIREALDLINEKLSIAVPMEITEQIAEEVGKEEQPKNEETPVNQAI